jgi:hypothetical protein
MDYRKGFLQLYPMDNKVLPALRSGNCVWTLFSGGAPEALRIRDFAASRLVTVV